MGKTIIEKDILQIKELLQKNLGTDEYTEISRLGGLTNHTYKVKVAGAEYAVRIPGEGTESMIVREDEMTSTKLACSLGIDADLIYFDRQGAKITKYISNAETMNSNTIKNSDNIKQISQIFKILHNCGENTNVPFKVFDMAAGYEKIICDNNVKMFDDYNDVKTEVMRIKNEIDSTIDIKMVPCHNDPLCENWVKGNDKMYLIDWEYAGMNDGMWDLADVSIEAGFDDTHDNMLLKAYLDREPKVEDKKHFLVNKIYVDFLWTLWAKARVPYDGQPMEDWAVERYARLKSFISKYNSI